MDYFPHLVALQEKYSELKNSLSSSVPSEVDPGVFYADLQEGLEVVRHNCFVVCLASRLSVDPVEHSFREHLSLFAGDYMMHSVANDADFNMTPDLFYKEEGPAEKKGEYYFKVVFYEVAVTTDTRGTRDRKYNKYIQTVNKFQSKIRKIFPDYDVQCLLNVMAVRNDLMNWDVLLNESGKSVRNVELEEECLRLCKSVNNTISLLLLNLSSLSALSMKNYKDKRGKNKASGPDFLEGVDINFEAIHDAIDELPDVMPRVETKPFSQYEGGMVDYFLDSYLPIWKDLKTGFEEPSPSLLRHAKLHTTKNLENNYLHLSTEDASPTFHFMHVPDTKNNLVGFEQRFLHMKSVLKSVKSDDSYIRFAKDVFSCSLNAVDRGVFFQEGTVTNWDDVKKVLVNVREPKVLKPSILSEVSKNVLRMACVGKKKAKIQEREGESYKTNRNNMPTLHWWKDEEFMEMESTVEDKACYLIQDSQSSYPMDVTKDAGLNESHKQCHSTNCRQLEDHIHRLSQYILYKGSHIGKGLHVVNTGNKNLWVVILPGGDVTENKGDVRFVQIAISEESTSREDVFKLFNREIVASTVKVGNQYLHVSRWMSLNRERWIHLEKACVYPFLTIMLERTGLNIQELKFLAFAYMYSAYGCQSKISGILDCFRYMITGAMSDSSGLADFIKEKMEIPVKTHGQAWLMRRLFELVSSHSKSRSEIVMKPQVYVDDVMTDESGGLEAKLSSPFIPKFKWLQREYSLGEVFIAFHLTGKAYHEQFMRDIDFVNSVIGGEVEYKELMKRWGAMEVRNGMTLSNYAKTLDEKRGGLYCREMVGWSGFLASSQCLIAEDKFNKDLQHEKLESSALLIQGLSSTKSSIEHAGFTKAKNYEVKTQTLLETTLHEVERVSQDVVQEIKRYGDLSLEIMTDLEKNTKEPEISTIPSYVSGEDGYQADSDQSGESAALSMKVKQKEVLKQVKHVFTKTRQAEDSLNFRLSLIDDVVMKEKLKEDLVLPERYADLESELVKKCGNHVSVLLNDGSHSVSPRKYDEMVYNLEIEMLKRGEETMYEKAKSLDVMMVSTESRFHMGPLRKDSVLFLALENLETIPLYKIVPKGQRTQDDREIFVQNKTRYMTYVEEHLCAAICKQSAQECITEPGERKMEKLRQLFERGQVWKRKELFVEGNEMVKTVKYITGDMSKFSNHDTPWRLRSWIEGIKENVPSKVYGLLSCFIRLATRKRVIAPMSLHKRVSEEDDIMKLFEKCNSKFPECKMEQNWLQGMRNFMASAAHIGACLSIGRILNQISPEEFYFDFLVHSDDWVICYGYSNPVWKCAITYDYSWREAYGITNTQELDKFLLNVIWFVYKSNNLTMSVKKSSISSKFVEFVSYVVNGGSCYMGYEKQLMAIFAEKPCVGVMEDIVSLLSQASSSILKGADSTVVDMVLRVSLDRLRRDYSFASGQKFDPVKWFGIPRTMLPLCFLPDLDTTSMDLTLCDIHVYDYNLVQDLYHQIIIEKNRDPIYKRAVKLLYAVSILQLGKKPNFECMHEVDPSYCLFPGIVFRPKNVEKVKEAIQLNSVFREEVVKHFNCYDFTSTLMPPKDVMFLLMFSHGKLLDPSVLISIMGSNKINLLRARGDFKNKATAKFRADETFTNLKGCFETLKLFVDFTADDEVENMILDLQMLSNNLNTVSKVNSDWITRLQGNKSLYAKQTTRALVLMPSATKTEVFNNDPKELIVEIVNPERYDLNRIDPKFPNSHAADRSTMVGLLGRSGFMKCRSNAERKKNLELLIKFIPREKRVMILTGRKQTYTSLEGCIRWVKCNNTYLLYKSYLEPTGPLRKSETIAGAVRKTRQTCMEEMSELVAFTTFSIMSGDSVQVVPVGEKTIADKLDEFRSSCFEKDLNLNEKYDFFYAFLRAHYLDDYDQCFRNMYRGFTMRYVKKDWDWKRGDPYMNAVIVISRLSMEVWLKFSEGVLTIEVDFPFDSRVLKESLNYFYKKTRNHFPLDNYRYFMSTKKDLVDKKCHYLVGRVGYYACISGASKNFPTQSVIAKVVRTVHKRTIIGASVDYYKGDLCYKIGESVVASLNFRLDLAGLSGYRLYNLECLVDVNRIIEKGMFSDFVSNQTTCFPGWVRGVARKDKIMRDQFKYFAALVGHMSTFIRGSRPVFLIERNEVADIKTIYVQPLHYPQLDTDLPHCGFMHDSDSESEGQAEDFVIDWDSSSSSHESRASASGDVYINIHDTDSSDWSDEQPGTSHKDAMFEKGEQSNDENKSSTPDSDEEREKEKIRLEYSDPKARRKMMNSIEVLEEWVCNSICLNGAQGEPYIDYMALLYQNLFDIENEKDSRFFFQKFANDPKKIEMVNALYCISKYISQHGLFHHDQFGEINLHNIRKKMKDLRDPRSPRSRLFKEFEFLCNHLLTDDLFEEKVDSDNDQT